MCRDFIESAVLVNLNLPRYQRRIIARLLCGILPIKIEVGRFTKMKCQRRFCKVCNKTIVEDETHFIICCERLKPQCKELIQPLLDAHPETKRMKDVEKLRWLSSSEVLKERLHKLSLYFESDRISYINNSIVIMPARHFTKLQVLNQIYLIPLVE